jgi:hypothetical protein
VKEGVSLKFPVNSFLNVKVELRQLIRQGV